MIFQLFEANRFPNGENGRHCRTSDQFFSKELNQPKMHARQGNLKGEQGTDSPAKQTRRQLIEKRRRKHVTELVKQDDEVIVKLENTAIERSNSVDSIILGKISIGRKKLTMKTKKTPVVLKTSLLGKVLSTLGYDGAVADVWSCGLILLAEIFLCYLTKTLSRRCLALQVMMISS